MYFSGNSVKTALPNPNEDTFRNKHFSCNLNDLIIIFKVHFAWNLTWHNLFFQPNHLEMLSHLLKLCFVMADSHSVSTNVNIKVIHHQIIWHVERSNCFISMYGVSWCDKWINGWNELIITIDSSFLIKSAILLKSIQMNKGPITLSLECSMFDVHEKCTSSVTHKNVILMWPNTYGHILLWTKNGLHFRSHNCIRSTFDLYPRQVMYTKGII